MCSTRNLKIKVTVNDLRFIRKRKNTNFPKLTKGPVVVLYQKKDSEKAVKQSTRWRKFLTDKNKKKKKKKKKDCNSINVFLWLDNSTGKALA